MLARYFYTTPSVVAANRDTFQPIYNLNQSRKALAGSSILPRMIVQNPQAAPQVNHDLVSWNTVENVLSGAADTVREAAHAGKEIVGGIVEPVLHHGSGLAVKPLSDIFGLWAAAYEGLTGGKNSQEPSQYQRYLRDEYTYQPRTEAGASPYNPLNSIPAWFGKLIELMQPNKPADASTAGGMFTNAVREAIPQAIGIAGAKLPGALKELGGDTHLPEGGDPNAGGPEGSRASTSTPVRKVETSTVKPKTPEPKAPEQQTSEQQTSEQQTSEQQTPEQQTPEQQTPEQQTREQQPPKQQTPEGTPEQETPPPDKTQQAALDAVNLSALNRLVQSTRLCRENPELCAKFIKEMAAQGDMHTLYVPKEAFGRMAQSRGTTADALLSRMPETQEKGGLFAIPAHEYFTALPEGMAGELSMFAKTDPARISLAEALGQARENAGSDARMVEGESGETTKDVGNAGSQSWADTHRPLPPEQVKVPGGGLRAHEALGGHALERHVDKTEQQLLDRYKKQPYIKASSSFYNEAVAEDSIAAALKANDVDIKTWLKSAKAGDTQKITTELPHDIGIAIPKGKTNAIPARKVAAVLKVNPHAPGGYFILTGFPTL